MARSVILGLFSSNKNYRSPARAHSSTDNPSRDVRPQNLVPPAMISVRSRIRLWFERGRDLECDHQSGVFWTTCNCLHNITKFYPPILKLCSLDRSWEIMGDMFELFGGLFSRSWERIRQTWWVFWCEKVILPFCRTLVNQRSSFNKTKCFGMPRIHFNPHESGLRNRVELADCLGNS